MQWRLFGLLITKIWKFLYGEKGSASIEFVLLAIPLFLPILIFLNNFSELSGSEILARNLVRESLRAYVTSANPLFANSRAEETLQIAARESGLTHEQISMMNLSFSCSQSPCLSPGGRIMAMLKMRLNRQTREVSAQAIEYISPWQRISWMP